MLDIIKADFYRIMRGKAFYITLSLLLAFIILQVVTGHTESLLSTNFGGESDSVLITGITAPFEMMSNSDTTLFFLLVFIVIIAVFDFSSGTAKNVLTSGVSRMEYYFAKLVLSLLFCFAISFLMVAVSSVSATIVRGFGGAFDMAFFGSLLRTFAAQLLILFAITCMGVFFVFTVKNVVAFVGLFLAFGLLPQLIIAFIASFFNEDTISVLWFFHFDLWGSAVRVARIGAMGTSDVIVALLIGVFYIAISTLGGIMLFKRSEIK